MILAVPVDQLREDYVLLTPSGYSENHITVVRPAGLAISMDGTAVSDGLFAAFGDGNWERAYLEVAEGVHSLDASAPFGVVAYGWSNAVSYGYPGGLNLEGN